MLKVLTAGLWSSIQDQGRVGYKHFGVPSAGCMDKYSANLANSLLNNSIEAAVIEITLLGPRLQFQADTQICICGADISALLNAKSVSNNTVINIQSGDELSFGRLNYGARAYVAIKHGFQTEIEMESKSFYQNITVHHRIETGSLIEYKESHCENVSARAQVKIDEAHFHSLNIDCFPGPEYELLDTKQKQSLVNQKFTLSKDYSRMGFQLNELINNSLKSMLSSAVLPGTVQLTPDGKLVILMRDCQSTGGYPRVLQLSEYAINRLSQKKPGDAIKFVISNV